MTSPMSKSAILACLIVLIGLAIIPLLGDKHAMDVTVEIMILALFALSLNVLIGYSGNVSFGHAAYFAIGGYTNAILLTTYNVPLIIAMPVADPVLDGGGHVRRLVLHKTDGHLLRHADAGIRHAGLGDPVQMAGHDQW